MGARCEMHTMRILRGYKRSCGLNTPLPNTPLPTGGSRRDGKPLASLAAKLSKWIVVNADMDSPSLQAYYRMNYSTRSFMCGHCMTRGFCAGDWGVRVVMQSPPPHAPGHGKRGGVYRLWGWQRGRAQHTKKHGCGVKIEDPSMRFLQL